MKKFKLLTLSAVLSTCISGPVLAESGYLYVGANAGHAFTKAQGDFSPVMNTITSNTQAQTGANANPIQTGTSHSTDRSGVPFSAVVGYQFDDYWGAELSYLNLGKASVSDNFTASGKDNNGNQSAFTQGLKITTKMQGAEASIIGHYPIDQGLGIIGKLGVLYGRYTTDGSVSSNGTKNGQPVDTSQYKTDVPGSTTQHKFSPVVGLGVRYAFTPTVNMNLMYTYYGKIGKNLGISSKVSSGEIGRAKVSTVMLGVNFGFPQ